MKGAVHICSKRIGSLDVDSLNFAMEAIPVQTLPETKATRLYKDTTSTEMDQNFCLGLACVDQLSLFPVIFLYSI